MGRLVVVNFISIDGVIQSPLAADEDPAGGFAHGGWVPPYSDETVDAFMSAATVNATGLLLGRRSYEIMTDAWAQADEGDPAVAAMNEMPKYVVSRSIGADDLGWANSERLDGDLPGSVAAVLERTDGHLVVFGSGLLAQGLAEHDLVDEYRLLLFPVVLGAGKRMFSDRSPLTRFDLTGSTVSASGVVLLTYTRRPPR